MHIFIAADHAGFELKSLVHSFLSSLGHEVEDMGAHTFNADDDYPDYVIPLAHRVVETPGSIGIVIGASGQGEAMAANRVRGIRAAIYYGVVDMSQTDSNNAVLNLVQSTRAHNDANILSLGARFLSAEAAQEAVRTFIDTPFSGDERHMRRIAALDVE